MSHFGTRPAVPDPAPCRPKLRQDLYLIYKEALHNVVKHAHGHRRSRVHLATPPAGLTPDRGRQRPGPAGAARPGGHGLANMQARAQAVGGTVRYEPQPVGFAVEVAVPLG